MPAYASLLDPCRAYCTVGNFGEVFFGFGKQGTGIVHVIKTSPIYTWVCMVLIIQFSWYQLRAAMPNLLLAHYIYGNDQKYRTEITMICIGWTLFYCLVILPPFLSSVTPTMGLRRYSTNTVSTWRRSCTSLHPLLLRSTTSRET